MRCSTIQGSRSQKRTLCVHLSDEVLVVGIERGGDVLTPKGETVIQPGDVVSLFSKSPIEKDSLEVFGTK